MNEFSQLCLYCGEEVRMGDDPYIVWLFGEITHYSCYYEVEREWRIYEPGRLVKCEEIA